MSSIPQHDCWAPPLSKINIEERADAWRELFGIDQYLYQPDMLRVLELEMPAIFEPYTFLVRQTQEGVEGQTEFSPPKIVLNPSVYNELVAEAPRARFTASHELGHFVLHAKAKPLNRAPPDRAGNNRLKAFNSAEWQANTFAASFLMPKRLVLRCGSAAEVQKNFNVSKIAATMRFEKVTEDR